MGIAISGDVPYQRRDAADERSERTRPRGSRNSECMNRLCLTCIGAYVAAATWAFGASLSFDLTISAGKHERKNVPVRVAISREQIGNARIASATLSPADG